MNAIERRLDEFKQEFSERAEEISRDLLDIDGLGEETIKIIFDDLYVASRKREFIGKSKGKSPPPGIEKRGRPSRVRWVIFKFLFRQWLKKRNKESLQERNKAKAGIATYRMIRQNNIDNSIEVSELGKYYDTIDKRIKEIEALFRPDNLPITIRRLEDADLSKDSFDSIEYKPGDPTEAFELLIGQEALEYLREKGKPKEKEDKEDEDKKKKAATKREQETRRESTPPPTHITIEGPYVEGDTIIHTTEESGKGTRISEKDKKEKEEVGEDKQWKEEQERKKEKQETRREPTPSQIYHDESLHLTFHISGQDKEERKEEDTGQDDSVFWNAFRTESKAETLSMLDDKKLDKYVHRQNIEELFDDFLDTDEKNCLAIVGYAGRGKTTLVHYLCKKRAEDKEDIVILIDCSSEQAKIEDRLKGIFTRIDKEREWDLESFLDEANSYVAKQNIHFLVFIDAIDRFRCESVKSGNLHGAPKALLEEINSFIQLIKKLSIGTQKDFSGIKIILTCRRRIWNEVTIEVNLLEERYHSQSGQPYVLLEEYDNREFKDALRKYLGEESARLSPTSKELCRDPYMLNIAATVYKEDLPDEIQTWDLMEAYLENFITYDKREVILSLASMMQQRRVDVVEARLEDNTHLLDSLVNEGILERRGYRDGYKRVSFKDERFFEFLMARELIDEVEGAFKKDNFLQIVQESIRFRYLQPALVMALANRGWNEDWLYQLAKIDEYRVKEVVVDVLTSKGIEQPEYIKHLLLGWLSKHETAAKTAIQVGHNLEDDGLLQEGLFSHSEQVRATAIQYISYLVKKDSGVVLEILKDLNYRIQHLFRNLTKIRRLFEAYVFISGATLAERFHDLDAMACLQEGWQSLLDKLCRTERRRSIFLTVATKLALRFLGAPPSGRKFYSDSYLKSLDAFFNSPNTTEKKRLLTVFAPYITLEKTEVEEISDEIVSALKMSDFILTFALCSLFRVQATLGIGRLIPVYRRFEEEQQIGLDEALTCIINATKLAPDCKGNETLIDVYRAIVKSKGFALGEGTAWLPVISDQMAIYRKVHGSAGLDIVEEYLERLEERESQELIGFFASSMEHLAIMEGYAKDAMLGLRGLSNASDMAEDSVVSAIGRIKCFHPQDVESFLETDLFSAEVRRRAKAIPSKESLETLSEIFWIYILNRVVAQSQTLIRRAIEIYCFASVCDDSKEYIREIIKSVTNMVYGKGIFPESPHQ